MKTFLIESRDTSGVTYQNYPDLDSAREVYAAIRKLGHTVALYSVEHFAGGRKEQLIKRFKGDK